MAKIWTYIETTKSGRIKSIKAYGSFRRMFQENDIQFNGETVDENQAYYLMRKWGNRYVDKTVHIQKNEVLKLKRK